ncbi:MAG TPA: PLP-dependent aminotransferase family protein [Burkholderiaceae bacterium]|nr:PLP-dependent aminotransferase family protein [Burkholderiaceae bacterium]
MRPSIPLGDLLRSAYADAAHDAQLPRYRVLYAAIREAILDHRLAPGTKLPSTRELARDLDLSRNTVLSTFDGLLAEGYLEARTGSGTYVAKGAAAPRARASRGARERAASGSAAPMPMPTLSRRGSRLAAFAGGRDYEILPLSGGEPDFSLFPIRQWQRLHSRHLRQGKAELLDYGSQGGYRPLRRAIADYVRVSRAVNADVEQVIVTGGTQHSLDLAAQLLADAGDVAWVEDPCYWGARCVLQTRDLRLEPVAVDDEGMNPDAAAPGSAPRLIYVTPSNQYPLGVAMSLARRRLLLDIAARSRAWILEDDYDSELRYSGRPLASLQGMDRGQRVIYFGTFSKVLYPGIKVGYLVVPPALVEAFRNALYDLQRPGQLTVQAALAEFIERGYFMTHLRRVRQAYAEQRELLAATLKPLEDQGISLSSQPSGLHLVVRLPPHVDDRALAARAAERGVLVRALSSYALGAPRACGLVVGYGYAPADQIVDHGRRLVGVIRDAARPNGRSGAAANFAPRGPGALRRSA